MNSSRLPGKVMMKLDIKNPTLHYAVTQLQACKLVNKIIVATSDLKQDDVIEDFCKKNKISVFRGSEKNCLDRYYQCAKKYLADIVIRIPADKPLIDPDLVDDVIEQFDLLKYDYVNNWLTGNVPCGTEVEAMTFDTLKKTWESVISSEHKEHVTPYIYENPKKFRIKLLEYSNFDTSIRYALDTKEDLIFIKELIKKIKMRPIHSKDITNCLKKTSKNQNEKK
jgi:spore coat polysaccharide biosynthesis protein SpsF